MNYTDWLFWPFLLAVTLLYWRLGHRGQNRLLLVSSYFFYGFWDYRFLFLILIATVIDFIGGLGVAGVRLAWPRLMKLGALLVVSHCLLYSGIDYALLTTSFWQGGGEAWPYLWSKLSNWKTLVTAGIFMAYGIVLPRLYALPEQTRRRTFLVISLASNLAILGFFKYYGFFADSLNRLTQFMGWPNPGWTILHLILPAGISFYTFQAMSYTIDVYQRRTTPTDHFGDFALFVCFFPHLVAGPIMRAHTLLPQVIQPRKWETGAFQSGFVLVLLGLFKKVVIADNLSGIANMVFMEFDTEPYPAGTEVLLGLYAFSLQIYGDFSGYSSIARGISKWLGFELAINFHLPYLAESPSDFWRRWHISLSSWLRDYLYIPLGGNRGGLWKTNRNMIVTMLLGGLWHGASWTFVLWGAYHGALLCFLRSWDKADRHSDARVHRYGWKLGRIFVMFHLICFGWLLFRVEHLGKASAMFSSLVTNFTFTAHVLPLLMLIFFFSGILFVIEGWLDGEHKIDRLCRAAWPLRSAIYAYLIFMIIVFRPGLQGEFIYFQF